jgi:rhodanese-related sulfurtransferase
MPRLIPALLFLVAALAARGAVPQAGESPADHLPPYIRQLTHFGERADWSHDGKRILFLSKTYGDALELDVASGAITNLTSHYAHYGYTRAVYLANGDILLSGPLAYDTANPGPARNQCYLSVLSAKEKKKPTPLGVRCNEGPAVSRRQLHIAWPEWISPKSGEGNLSSSKLFEADIVYTDGVPALANQRLIIDGADLPFRCTMESQNFRPPNDRELTFSAYQEGGRKCDVIGIDLTTKKITKYTDTPAVYDEPEGIFPDGQYTLVECDSQNLLGPGNIDLWKLRLDDSRTYTRITHFSDYPGYKASNGVVSDDGKFIAFQMGHAGEAAGIGHGVFVLDLTKMPAAEVAVISPAEAAKLVAEGKAVLVDVREPSEWAESGVAAPAALLPKSEFDEGLIGEWPDFLAKNKDKQIITYCRVGRRAGAVAAALAAKGYQTANAGGFKDWQAAGLPTRAGLPEKH